MSKRPKNISLEEDVLEKGLTMAKKMFSGNFSVYVTYLINKDFENYGNKEDLPIRKEKTKELDEDIKDSMDDILNM